MQSVASGAQHSAAQRSTARTRDAHAHVSCTVVPFCLEVHPRIAIPLCLPYGGTWVPCAVPVLPRLPRGVWSVQRHAALPWGCLSGKHEGRVWVCARRTSTSRRCSGRRALLFLTVCSTSQTSRLTGSLLAARLGLLDWLRLFLFVFWVLVVSSDFLFPGAVDIATRSGSCRRNRRQFSETGIARVCSTH